MAADYELSYTVWQPWPDRWVVGFRDNVVVGTAYIPYLSSGDL
jgi:hypothetical protein